MESSADAVWIAIRRGDMPMLELLASHGAVWEIPIALDGTLTYKRIVATGLRRSVGVLAYYGDTATAEPLLAANPALADDPEALLKPPQGHEEFVRLLLRYQPDLAKRVTDPRPAGNGRAALRARHGSQPAELAADHATARFRGQW